MASNGRTDGKLSTKQRRAVAALLSSRDHAAAAKAAGIGKRTLARWLAEDDAFRAELDAAEARLVAAAIRRLVGLQDCALSVLENVMRDPDAPPATRTRAAALVLSHLVKVQSLRPPDPDRPLRIVVEYADEGFNYHDAVAAIAYDGDG